jgi:hypothetical protein
MEGSHVESFQTTPASEQRKKHANPGTTAIGKMTKFPNLSCFFEEKL